MISCTIRTLGRQGLLRTAWTRGLRPGGPSLCSAGARTLSSAADSSFQHVQLTSDDSQGWAVLRMCKPPVNSLSLEMMTELNLALEKSENNKSCRGLIMTSSVPKIFCAGLDIMELYQPKQERLTQFWRTLQDLWLRLYSSRLITIAAITGHSPAGGCLLAMSCDHRIMAAGKYAIGLNETLLGIVAPFWFRDTMTRTIGERETERALQLGQMYSSAEALKVGLIDEVVDEAAVMQHAEKEMAKWLRVPDAARILTKNALRNETCQRLETRREEDIASFVKFVTHDQVQKALGLYLASLKKK